MSRAGHGCRDQEDPTVPLPDAGELSSCCSCISHSRVFSLIVDPLSPHSIGERGSPNSDGSTTDDRRGQDTGRQTKQDNRQYRLLDRVDGRVPIVVRIDHLRASQRVFHFPSPPIEDRLFPYSEPVHFFEVEPAEVFR